MPTGYWVRRRLVEIGPRALKGVLSVPDRAKGLVVFVCQGAGASHRRRTVRTAAELHARQFATLLFEHLAHDCAVAERAPVDVDELTQIVREVVHYAACNSTTAALPVGLFGEAGGAAATLSAGADLPDVVSAIVVRGDRPDLAGAALGHVSAPTLMIASGSNHASLKHNREAYRRLTCVKQLEIVPGGFAEHDALHATNNVAGHWFDLYLIPRAAVKASAAGKR